MNYRDVVDRIRQVVFDHNMLVDFGYGQLSDIKTRSEGEGEQDGADYPYLFLNPTQHQRSETQITYNFNMIVMDMAREEEGDVYQNFLGIQSDCIQYIDDVVARLYYHYKDKPEIQFNYSYTPFYERFQDQLAGATANIQIIVPTNIDNCIAPFDPVITCAQTLPQWSDNSIEAPAYYLGADSQYNNLRWETDLQTDPAIGLWNDIILLAAQSGTFEFRIEQEISFDEPVAGQTLALPPKLIAGGVEYDAVCDSGNWPTQWTSLDPIIYTATYRGFLASQQNALIQLVPVNGITQSPIVQLGSSGAFGGNLKIGFEAE